MSSRKGNHCVTRTRCVAEPNNGSEVVLTLFMKITKDQTGRKDRAERGHSVSPPFVFLV